MTSNLSPQLRFALNTIAACALLASASGQIHAQTAIGTGTSSVRPGEPVTLNFANAEIEAVARTMATITGRNVVVDPRVKGQLTLITERAVTPAAAFQQFLAALRLQGFTVVESAGLYKVVPEADAKLQGGSVSVSRGGAPGPGGGQIVTQIFKLNYENAAMGGTARSVISVSWPLTRGSTTTLRPVMVAMVRATASISALAKFSVTGSLWRTLPVPVFTAV